MPLHAFTLPFLLQMAPDCEEDACKVEEGGRLRFREFGKELEHKRQKTTAPPCKWPESCHGGSNFQSSFLLFSFNPLSSNFQTTCLISISTSSLAGGSGGRRSPSNVPAHLQRQRERPHPRLQLQSLKALARGQGPIQS